MVAVKVKGLDELRRALKDLPADLAQQNRAHVEAATRDAAAALRSAYPRGDTGNLRAGVKTEFDVTPTGTVGTVISRSPHAHLWEFGTVNRRTQQGWNRGRLASQIHRGLTAIAPRERRKLNAAIIDTLRDDFKVSGHAG